MRYKDKLKKKTASRDLDGVFGHLFWVLFTSIDRPNAWRSAQTADVGDHEIFCLRFFSVVNTRPQAVQMRLNK